MLASLIKSQVIDYKVQGYQDGDFKEFTAEATKGKWAVYVFYPADFTFVCPTELRDLADKFFKISILISLNLIINDLSSD